VPEQADCSDELVALQHRNNKKGSYAPEFDGFDIRGAAFLYVLLFGCKISCVDHGLGHHQATEKSCRTGTNRRELTCLGEGWRCLVRRHESKSLAIPSEDISKGGIADANSRLQHGLKNWLQFTGRRTDDTQHFRCCSLLFQRLVAFTGEPSDLLLLCNR
jgi:hypothetical protein